MCPDFANTPPLMASLDEVKRRIFSNEMFSVLQILEVPINEMANRQPLVALPRHEKIKFQVDPTFFEPSVGDQIVVREEVSRRLLIIGDNLAENHPDLSLGVFFAYRSAQTQRDKFYSERLKLQSAHPALSDPELDERTHILIAHPDAAAHPAGAAVDVTLLDSSGNSIDMGSQILKFDEAEKVAPFSEAISSAQMERRVLLRELMMVARFAPYNGEWWHFSFGDREWALFYGQSEAKFASCELPAHLQKKANTGKD